eukprot:Hpha_TRINITY_DN1752_c0_g1::TRINITY_DN1752_c0_g1_i1::g.158459::m.158459
MPESLGNPSLDMPPILAALPPSPAVPPDDSPDDPPDASPDASPGSQSRSPTPPGAESAGGQPPPPSQAPLSSLPPTPRAQVRTKLPVPPLPPGAPAEIKRPATPPRPSTPPLPPEGFKFKSSALPPAAESAPTGAAPPGVPPIVWLNRSKRPQKRPDSESDDATQQSQGVAVTMPPSDAVLAPPSQVVSQEPIAPIAAPILPLVQPALGSEGASTGEAPPPPAAAAPAPPDHPSLSSPVAESAASGGGLGAPHPLKKAAKGPAVVGGDASSMESPHASTEQT